MPCVNVSVSLSETKSEREFHMAALFCILQKYVVPSQKLRTFPNFLPFAFSAPRSGSPHKYMSVCVCATLLQLSVGNLKQKYNIAVGLLGHK